MANNTTMNSTNGTDGEEPAFGLHYFAGTTIFCTVFVFVMLIPTAVVNGLTLFAIYKDPLKCFRNPLAIFLTGVIVPDFLSALLAYPIMGAAYAHSLRLREDWYVSDETWHVGIETMSTIVIISFLTFLALAISQLMAIRWPMRYERCVTNRSAKIGLVSIWIYAVIFVTFAHIFDAGEAFYMVHLVFHISVVSVALLILYIVTYCVFRARTRQMDTDDNKHVNREFLKGTSLLALLQILFVWPFSIALYLEVLVPPDENNKQSLIAADVVYFIMDNFLIIKFLLDPIVLVWRIPKYRQAMKMVYASCLGYKGETEEERRAVSFNRNNVAGSNKNPEEESLDDAEVEVL